MAHSELEARLFRILSNPARLDLLACLRDGEACVCHLEAALGLRQAYISQQLAVLRQAGLVQDRREGLNIYYHLAEPRLAPVLDAARQATGQSGPARRLQSVPLAACPCPKCNSAATAAASPG
ncbi:MAG: metalloregulator ArsR/SmtB family transcription factor [Anaerolineales bacterium]